MAMIRFTLRCDWPDCGREETFECYAGSVPDKGWVERTYVGDAPVAEALCPLHRFNTWRELDEEMYKDHQ